MTKARKVFEEAMTLYGIVTEEGQIDETRAAPYRARAIIALNLLQRDVFKEENPDDIRRDVPKDIKDLSDELSVSDDAAARCLPYGLVMHFAELDRDALLYNTYYIEYTNRLQGLAKPRTKIKNVRGRLFS